MSLEHKSFEQRIPEREPSIVLIQPSLLIKDNFAFEALNAGTIIGPFSPARYAKSLADVVKVGNPDGSISLKVLDGHNRIHRAALEMGNSYKMNAVDATERILEKIAPGSEKQALTVAEYLEVIPVPTRKEHMDKRMAGHILTEWKGVASDAEDYGALAALLELGFSNLTNFSPEKVALCFADHPYKERLVLLARSLQAADVSPPQVARRAFEIVQDQMEDPRVPKLVKGILTIPSINGKIVRESKDSVDFGKRSGDLENLVMHAIPTLTTSASMDNFGRFLTDPELTYLQFRSVISVPSDIRGRYDSVKTTKNVDALTMAYKEAIGGREITATEDIIIQNLCPARSLSESEIASRIENVRFTEEILQRVNTYLSHSSDEKLFGMAELLLEATTGQALGKRRKAIIDYLAQRKSNDSGKETMVYEVPKPELGNGTLDAAGILAMIDRLPSGKLDGETVGALERLAVAVNERIGAFRNRTSQIQESPVVVDLPSLRERSVVEKVSKHPLTERISSNLSRLFSKELTDRVVPYLVGGSGETGIDVVDTFFAPRVGEFIKEAKIMLDSSDISYLTYTFCRRNLMMQQESDNSDEITALITAMDKRMLAGTGGITNFEKNPGIKREIPLVKTGNHAYADLVELAFYSEPSYARHLSRSKLKDGIGDAVVTRSYAEKFMPAGWKWLTATVRSPESIVSIAEERNMEVNQKIQQLYEGLLLSNQRSREDAN